MQTRSAYNQRGDAKRGLWPIVVTTLQLMGVVVCVLMVADMARGL